MRAVQAILLIAVSLALVACQSLGSGGASGDRLARILESGELRVAITADLPPLSMQDSSGEVTGFEADLVRALADAMDLDVRFVVTPFPELLGALDRGEADLVISGMTITPERNSRFAFAGPYFISGTSVVSKSRDITDLQDPAELDLPTRSYAALAGSTSARFVEDALPQAKLVATMDYESAVQKLLNDEVDALFADSLACKLAVWRNPDAGLSAALQPFTTEPLGIALPADDPLLLNLVQNYLNTLENTGVLTQFKAKWLADGSWFAELP